MSILILPSIISSKIFIDDFLFIVSLEKITDLYSEKIDFTSSNIFSTPGPEKAKSHFFHQHNFYPSLFYVHNNDRAVDYFFVIDKIY